MNTKNIASILKRLLIYVVFGVICGIIGTVFSNSVSFVTSIRQNNPWLLYFLPVAGLVSVAIYKFLKVVDMGTNQVIKSTETNNVLSCKLAPAVFFASLLSHLCGASVGREGAALQLGGSFALFLNKIFKLNREEEKVLIYCGMAGLFSSVFGTPLTAVLFALEVVIVGRIYYKAAVPVCITSFASYYISVLFNTNGEHFVLSAVPALNFIVICKVLLLSLFTVGISILFCFSLNYCKKLLKTMLKNDYLRIAVGGIIIVFLTVIVDSYDYNGAGIDVIEKIFNNNEFVPLAFVFKMLFTCFAVGTGFKGGEIVPTLFIGATFGAIVGTLLGLPAAFSAALCMVALFCGVTNCPLASIFLAVELFSGKGIEYILVAVAVTYCLSGKISLYSAQKTNGLKSLF